MDAATALAFVKTHGVVLESGRGPVPSLVEAITGSPVRGSWWSHPQGRAIFRATRAVREADQVLVCRLLDDKITYVHRRLWPALVRLASQFGARRLDAIREEHTAAGAHRLAVVPFPSWLPKAVAQAAAKLSEADARNGLGAWARPAGARTRRKVPRRRTAGVRAQRAR